MLVAHKESNSSANLAKVILLYEESYRSAKSHIAQRRVIELSKESGRIIFVAEPRFVSLGEDSTVEIHIAQRRAILLSGCSVSTVA